MKYTLQVEINAPRDRVVDLLTNQEMLKQWQPELVEYELLSGHQSKKDAVTKLIYRYGNRNVEMTETILSDQLPELLQVYYKADQVSNWVDNRFIELNSGKCIWKMESEFKCNGFMKIITLLYPGLFKNSTLKSMERFKEQVEKEVDFVTI